MKSVHLFMGMLLAGCSQAPTATPNSTGSETPSALKVVIKPEVVVEPPLVVDEHEA